MIEIKTNDGRRGYGSRNIVCNFFFYVNYVQKATVAVVHFFIIERDLGKILSQK